MLGFTENCIPSALTLSGFKTNRCQSNIEGSSSQIWYWPYEIKMFYEFLQKFQQHSPAN